MAIEVYREKPDGLSREVWRFYVGSDREDFILRLNQYGVEKRNQPKGRFKKMAPQDRWDSMDERHYYSGLKRPTAIPPDVVHEAMAQVRVRVVAGNGDLAEVNLDPRRA